MRPTAQIDPLPLTVERDFLTLGQALDDFGFVNLSFLAEELNGLTPVPDLSLHRQRIFDDTTHFRAYAVQIFHRETGRIREIVEKTILDHRTDGRLRFGVKTLHSLRHQVSGRVADYFKPFDIPVGDDTQGGIIFDQVAGIAQYTINFTSQGRLGQARADIARHFHDRDRLVELSLAPVG